MGTRNPYTDRTGVRDIGRFYGRRLEVSRIYSRIGAPNPQSVSIVGDRRIGKSSLLNFIYHEDNRNKHLGDPENYVFVLMDLQEEPNDTVPDLIGSLLGRVSETPGHSVSPVGTGYDALKRLARELQREGRKLIIILDEFELVTQNEAFDSAFYAFLRGLASNYDIAFVTSSVRDLQEMCRVKAIANSPFFNIFSKIHLGPLHKPEAMELIGEPSSEAGYPLSEHVDAILSMSGLLPIFIQMACSAFFEYIQTGEKVTSEDDIGQVEGIFFEEAEPHFRYIWDGFSSLSKEICQSILTGEDITGEEKEIPLADLIRRGYVIEEERGYRLFSSIFARRMVPLHAKRLGPEDGISMVASREASAVTEEHIQQLAEVLDSQEPRFGEFIGRCEEMQRVYRQIEMAASFDRPVLIRGETGTGKELVARAIHSLSSRGRFEAINCAAITKELAESFLFGHERGAFTGAHSRQEGRFMIADGGTIFFDEIGELNVDLQAKLLRVLETKTFQRVGGHEQIQVDVCVVAATNRNLEEAIKDARFREDLYYRLNVFEIRLPPLRERGQDILLLALHFLKSFAQENPTVKAQTISTQVAEILLGHPWPGNVRELKSVIERAAMTSKERELTPGDFRGISGFESLPDSDLISIQIRSLDEMKSEIAHIRYESGEKNYRRAAESLGINERTLRSWLERPRETDKRGIGDLRIPVAQYGSWEDIECRAIEKMLEHTEDNNPKAADILGIALSTFLKKRKKYGI